MVTKLGTNWSLWRSKIGESKCSSYVTCSDAPLIEYNQFIFSLFQLIASRKVHSIANHVHNHTISRVCVWHRVKPFSLFAYSLNFYLIVTLQRLCQGIWCNKLIIDWHSLQQGYIIFMSTLFSKWSRWSGVGPINAYLEVRFLCFQCSMPCGWWYHPNRLLSTAPNVPPDFYPSRPVFHVCFGLHSHTHTGTFSWSIVQSTQQEKHRRRHFQFTMLAHDHFGAHEQRVTMRKNLIFEEAQSRAGT